MKKPRPKPVKSSGRSGESERADELLTPVEAAISKGVTRSAVYKAIAEGRLPQRKVLGRVALRAQDVAAWTPTPYVGRPRGKPMSAQARANISAGQKRRWERDKREAKHQAKPK